MPTTNERKYYQKAEDKTLLVLIKDIVSERPTYGYRRVGLLRNS